ncbi:MAG: type II toxin-antitoxin system RelE/ParE family toxin [Deltaproteobacteria bacterium]|nr:type II toxin-antitoxin system RelE/ParE family toxin [Deltaproteobacteria bacterium]MBW1819936.1 type II toxin-antitoxin system RelE/ParE family toxin [Deltaproteobacteria bacterium]
MKSLRVPGHLVALIRGMHPLLKKKTKAALQTLVVDPFTGKILKDELYGLRSLRAGRFRIVYRIQSGKETDVIAIGPRNRIYEETYRILKRQKAAITLTRIEKNR